VSGYEAYDRLAPHYRAYASTRAAYVDAVDDFVVRHATGAKRMLDAGSGDGVRAVALARRLGVSHLVLCEPSERMAALCRQQAVTAVWTEPVQSLPAHAERFDVVTCLWNVLGHLPDRATRIAALRAMARLLAPAGRIFCDVNNRHNVRAYGFGIVTLRRLLDGIAPDERRGDAEFEWSIGGERIPARGHLFTPAEMDSLVQAAGLEVEQRLAVDYQSGESSPCPRLGQLVYRLRARNSSATEAPQ
jgi:SAM-dependent methyltransferase